MLLWFAVFSVLGVYAVFRDDRMDYRFVVAGSLLPDLFDFGLKRGVGPLHSVVVGVGLLFGVVISTIGRRPSRKRWLAVPIGIFAHQILDGAWVNTRVFWWPFAGLSVNGHLPVTQHGLAFGLLEELGAVAVMIWAWKAFGLNNPTRRAQLIGTGQLPQQRHRLQKSLRLQGPQKRVQSKTRPSHSTGAQPDQSRQDTGSNDDGMRQTPTMRTKSSEQRNGTRADNHDGVGK